MSAEWIPERTDCVFSKGRIHRYTLERVWSEINHTRVAFIGLNPSTADELQDDPTVRRCIRYAKKWGFGGMIMLNIFGLRSTDPKALYRHTEPIGGHNDFYILKTVDRKDVRLVVACWGNHGAYLSRGWSVRRMVERLTQMQCLGKTKFGEPKHPLYLRGDLEPEVL